MCKHEGFDPSGDGRCPAVWKEQPPLADPDNSSPDALAASQDVTENVDGASINNKSSPVGIMELGFPFLGEVQRLPVHQWPEQVSEDISVGDGVTVPAGSWVMHVGGKLWMKDA